LRTKFQNKFKSSGYASILLVPTPDFVSKLATPLADTKFGKSLPHLKTYSTFVENGTPE